MDAPTGGANMPRWALSLAIAEPTHALIEAGSANEREAMREPPPFYFPGEPLPMLPDAARPPCVRSARIRRACFSVAICRLTTMASGDYQFSPGSIRSHGKLSYDWLPT